MKKTTAFAVSAVALAMGIFVGLFYGNRHAHEKRVTTDITTDTVIQVDTVVIKAPAAVAYTPAETVYRALASIIEDIDTPTVAVPLVQKLYTDSANYTAWITGYEARLDSIRLSKPVVTVTKTVSGKNHRWGLSAGAGVAFTPNGIQPAISVGVTYTFYTF